MPKDVIRCGNCANRVYDEGVGFVPQTTHICGLFSCEVTLGDGCTFGEPGKGSKMSRLVMVDLSNYGETVEPDEMEEDYGEDES